MHNSEKCCLGNADRDFSLVFAARKEATHASLADYAANTKADLYVFQLANKFVPAGGKVLDLGCNAGNNALPLASRFEVFGVDLNADFLDCVAGAAAQLGFSKNLHLSMWDVGENGDLPWPDMDRSFGAIVATHFFSHFTSDHFIRTVHALRRYLAPGGVMITTIMKAFELELSEAESNLPPTNLGIVTHCDEVIEKAFSGMIRTADCRLLRAEELVWPLALTNHWWLVYQEPA